MAAIPAVPINRTVDPHALPNTCQAIASRPGAQQILAINDIETLAIGTSLQCQQVLTHLNVQDNQAPPQPLPVAFPYQSREWGLAYDAANHFWIFGLGGPGEVSWKGNGLEALHHAVHTHPPDLALAGLIPQPLATLQQTFFDMGTGALAAKTFEAILDWFADYNEHVCSFTIELQFTTLIKHSRSGFY